MKYPYIIKIIFNLIIKDWNGIELFFSFLFYNRSDKLFNIYVKFIIYSLITKKKIQI